MDSLDIIKELFTKAMSQTVSEAKNPIEYGLAGKEVQRNTALFKGLVQSAKLILWIFSFVGLVYMQLRGAYFFTKDNSVPIMSAITILIVAIIVFVVMLIVKYCAEEDVITYWLDLIGIVYVSVAIGVISLVFCLHVYVLPDGMISVNFMDFSLENIVIVIVLGCIFFVIIYIYHVAFCINSMSNLSFVYFYDKNIGKVYIYHKEDGKFLCSCKEYIRCNKKYEREFVKELKKIHKKLKNKLGSEIEDLDKLKRYIEQIESFGAYIKLDEKIAKSFFEKMELYYAMNDSEFSKKDFFKYCRKINNKFEKVTSFFLVDEKDVTSFFMVRKNEQKFYF